MRKKGVGKRILSVLLALSMVVSVVPTNVFAAYQTAVDSTTTSDNVNTILNLEDLMIKNNLRDGTGESYATGMFTWDSEGKNRSWTYYNGIMLKAFMDAGGTTETDYVRKFYDDLIKYDSSSKTISIENYVTNTNTGETDSQYLEGELDSVPMGLALFDLLDQPDETITITPSPTANPVYSGSAVTLPPTSNSIATVDGTKITFNSTDSIENFDGCGLEVTNPFANKTGLSDGVSISFWYTPQALPWATWAEPLITFINMDTSHTKTVTETVTNEDGSTTTSDVTKLYPQLLRFDVWGSRQFNDHYNGGSITYPANTITDNYLEVGKESFITLVITNSSLEMYVDGVAVSRYTTNYTCKNDPKVIDMLTSSNTKMYIGGVQVDESAYNNIPIYDIDNINKEDYKHSLKENTVVNEVKFYDKAVDAAALYKEVYAAKTYTPENSVELKYELPIAAYKEAIHYIYNELSQQTSYDECGGNYLHKDNWTTYNIGLDGLYMAQPFLMKYARAIDSTDSDNKIENKYNVNTSDIYKAVYERFMWVADEMYDSATGLYHHGWSVAGNTEDEKNGNGHFWTRGIGWYAAALVDVIELMPDTYKETYKKNLSEKLTKLFDGMLTWQNAYTGMWTNVTNREDALTNGERTNLEEASGTALMAYALMKAYNNGYVTDVKYGKAGLAAFNGVVKNNVEGSGTSSSVSVRDIYESSSVSNTDTGYLVNKYVTNEAKGVGPLIMAALQANAVAGKISDTSVSTVESVKDANTNVTVSGSGATAIEIVDNSDTDTNLKAAVAKLAEGYAVYGINLTGDTNSATISIPVSNGETVYEVGAGGTLIPVTGTLVDNTNFEFRVKEAGIYVVGTLAADWSQSLPWVTVGDSSESRYMLVDKMVPDKEYVLEIKADGLIVIWVNREDKNGIMLNNGQSGWKSDITISNPDAYGVYTLANVNDAEKWYIDSKNRIFTYVNASTQYYLPNYTGDIWLTADPNSAYEWQIVPSSTSGYNYIKTANNLYLRQGKYSTYITVDSKSSDEEQNSIHIFEKATPDKAALVGTTEYSMKLGDTSITKEVIQQNADVYYRAYDGADAVKLDWTDTNISVAWNEYTPEIAGKYELPVKYDGVEIGKITINVNGYGWTEIPAKYKIVTEMDPDNKAGYIITQYAMQNYALWWRENASKVPELGYLVATTDDEKNAEKVLYQLNIGVDADKDGYHVITDNSPEAVWSYKWFITENGLIYTKNGNDTYYLTHAADSYDRLYLASEESDAVKWNIVLATAYGEGEEDVVDDTLLKLGVTEKIRYLKIGSTSGNTTTDVENHQYDQTKLAIWERNPVTYVSLMGTKEYSVNQGDKVVTEESIKENATLYALTTTSDDKQVLSWDDPLVKCEWDNNFTTNVSTDTTYTMTVKYDGVKVGEVKVNVKASTWKEIPKAPATFSLVTIPESNTSGTLTVDKDGYVIAPFKSAENPNMTSIGTLTYSSSNSVKYESISVSDYNSSTKTGRFSLNGNGSNLWYLNSTGTNDEYYIYCIVDGKTYYLTYQSGPKLVLSSSTSDDAKFIVNREKAVGEEGFNETYLKITKTVNEKNYYVRVDAGEYVDIFEYNSTWGNNLWAKNLSEAALYGTTSYTIKQGDTSLTETKILMNLDAMIRDSSSDTTPTVIPWDQVVSDTDGTKTLQYTWDKKYDPETPGTYTMTVTYYGVEIGKVTVVVEQYIEIAQSLTGNNETIITSKGRQPNFGDIVYTITYSDGSVQEYTVANGLTISGYDINVLGPQTANIYYDGKNIGTVSIDVQEGLYTGLDPATSPYPEYPEKGAVRIDKEAINDEFMFNDTGVTQVELNVAGIAERSSVDVVLVVDVSNSMGWTDHWFDTYTGDIKSANDVDRIPYNDNGEPDPTATDKLDQAMAAASTFATTLLEKNVAEGHANFSKNNTISFVTFAGYDADNINQIDTTMIDSTKTIFTGEMNAGNASTVFGNTKFTSYTPNNSGGVEYKLQIGGVEVTDEGTNYEKVFNGINRGNTNYDYAFSQAMQAVNELHGTYYNKTGKSYESSDRETIVLFMTDGAATHYNGERASGNAGDRLYGTTITYDPIGAYTTSGNNTTNWLKQLTKPNMYATELDAMVDYFYAIGFDLDHGGFGKEMQWTADELVNVLHNLAGTDYKGAYEVDKVELASDGAALMKFYKELAESLAYSGSNAVVTDVIKENFTLQMGKYFTTVEQLNEDGTVDTEASFKQVVDNSGNPITTDIEVRLYDLYDSTDVNDYDKIGTRKTLEDGSYDYDIIERVYFETTTIIDDNGNEKEILAAYSTADSKKYPNGTPMNILTFGTDGSVTIEAESFTYTKVITADHPDGKETFEWYIGDIKEDEVALSYYAYLKGAKEIKTSPEDNVYDTNESAVLDYINYAGDHAQQVFPIPKRAWGTAVTEVEYYLVNERGEPVNWVGEVIPFANRIIVNDPSETYTQTIRWGDTLVVNGAEHTPYGYTMFDQTASYTVTAIDDKTGSFNIDKTNALPVKDENGNLVSDTSTYRIDKDTASYGYTQVTFAVIYVGEGKEVTFRIGEDRIVVDYGKVIQENVFANNPRIGSTDLEYTCTVTGFAWYSADEKYHNYTQSDPGAVSLQTDYGTFTLVRDADDSNDNTEIVDTVQYKMNKMLSVVDKVFTVVKVTEKANEKNYYYLYQPLFVIPATVMYYETDFVEGAFSTVVNNTAETIEEWSDVTSEETSAAPARELNDQIQDDGTISFDVTTTVDGIENTTHPYIQTYGYDGSYTNDSKLSDGKSLFVEGQGADYTTAEFTFTGTGFDIISVTGKAQGMIRVNVYDTATLSLKKKMSVLNKHESVENDYYQIPVISIEDLAYGSYKVVIEVFKSATYSGNLAALSRGNEFYFDAVRIYDPLGSVKDGYSGDTEGIGLQAYMADGEAYPDKQEVRDKLITAGNYDVTGAYNEGFLFIERSEGDDTTSPEVTVTPEVTISPSPEVTISPSPEVTISPSPEVTISPSPEVEPTPDVSGMPEGTIIDTSYIENSDYDYPATFTNNSISFKEATWPNYDGVQITNLFKENSSDVLSNGATISLSITPVIDVVSNANGNVDYDPVIVFRSEYKQEYLSFCLDGRRSYSSSNSSLDYWRTEIDLKANQEVILTFVIKAEEMITYVNGQPVVDYYLNEWSYSPSKSGTFNLLSFITNNTTSLFIGGAETKDAYKTNSSFANGTLINNITTYNKALTSDEVSALSTSVTSGVSEVSLYSSEDVTSSSGSHNHNIADYDAIGPNNETYLAEGQAIVFKLEGIDTENIASIDVGAKSIDGSQVNMKAVISNSSEIAFNDKNESDETNKAYKVIPETLYSSTSQYIELYSGDEGYSTIDSNGNTYIYISNTGVGEIDQDGTQLNTTNVLSITDIKVAYKSSPTSLSTTSNLSYVAGESLLSFADACYQLEPDYDIHHEAFTPASVKIFGNADLTIETSEYVERLEITDRFGRPVDFEVSNVSTLSGSKKWNVVIMVDKIGNQVYKITGYGASGHSGETVQATVNVNKQEGGWQDAKSIYKTLFNCRILSIKRSGSNKLYGESK